MRVYPPVPANHPWKKAALPQPSKTEEDTALERFDNLGERHDQQLQTDSERQ